MLTATRRTDSRVFSRPAGLMAAAFVALAGLCAVAGAAVPSALDRVPADAAMAGGVANLTTFHNNFNAMGSALKLESLDALKKMDALFQAQGIKKDGSAAVAILEVPQDGGDGMPGEGMRNAPMVIIVPVTDYKAFVTGLGGDAASPIAELKGQQTMFAKDIGGGYAALSPKRELTESFEGKGGNLEAHTKALGAVGTRVADKSDVVLVANVSKLAPKIKDGIKDMKEQAEMVGQMGGGNAPNTKILEIIAENWVRDAQTGVIGLNFSAENISIDVASQFKPGSELAGLFNSDGNSAGLLNSVPNKPFLFAIAMDTSSASMKKMLKGMFDTSKDMAKPGEKNAVAEASGMWEALLAKPEGFDGAAFTVGYSPAGLSAGLLSQTVGFIKTNKSSDYLKLTGDVMTKMNGTKVDGMQYTTEYKAAAVDVSGVKADSWSMAMTPSDPNDPMAMQVQMMMGFITGPAGKFQGLSAPTDKGVVMTYGQYAPFMDEALKAAKNGEGLGKSLAEASKLLPANRNFEMWIGSKSLIDTLGGFAAMMGGPAVSAPADLPPVAMAATGDASGAQLRIVVPTKVITTVQEIGKKVQSEMGGGDPMDDQGAPEEKKDGGKPKF
ncbi:MAG: hypothetical protein KGS45_01985 [Planctomycetes bacterium]|nr:hypothetical protein [Planctomycetota bacterium]